MHIGLDVHIKVEQSGDYIRYEYLNKHSNGFLRWALILSARAVVCSSTPPNRFQGIYHKLKAGTLIRHYVHILDKITKRKWVESGGTFYG